MTLTRKKSGSTRSRRSKRTYEEFLHDLRLIDISLTSSRSDLEMSAYVDVVEHPKKVKRTLSASYELEFVGDNFFSATAKLSAAIHLPLSGDGDAVKIECAYRLHFHCRGPAEEQYAKRFADSGVRLLIWPYFRQFVSDMTARMSIPPITIPLSTER